MESPTLTAFLAFLSSAEHPTKSECHVARMWNGYKYVVNLLNFPEALRMIIVASEKLYLSWSFCQKGPHLTTLGGLLLLFFKFLFFLGACLL